MAHVSGERCLETTTKEGTGILTVLGPVVGYRSLASRATVNGDTFFGVMAGGSQWQVALYTRNSATTFTPTAIYASSAAGAEISWSAGTKEIWIDTPESKINIGPDGTVAAPAIGFWDDPDTGIYRIGANNLGIAAGGVKVLDIGSDGITRPTMPAFLAYNSATDTNATGDGTTVTVDFDTEVFDRGSDFAADTFTAPVTGLYDLDTSVALITIVAGHSSAFINIVTSNRSYRGSWFNPINMRDAINDIVGASMSVLADMDAGDTALVQVTVAGSTKTVGVYGTTSPTTYFCGHLVG